MTVAALRAPCSWDEAVARYLAAVRFQKATPIGSDQDDAVVDAECEAQDFLIEQVPAPNIAALGLKLHWAMERADAFGAIFDDHAKAIFADIASLSAAGVSAAAAQDPHPQWLADRNRVFMIANRHQPMPDDLMGDLTSLCCELETRITETPATTVTGWAAKAAVALQVPSEGFEVSDEQAATVLKEGVKLFGLNVTPLALLATAGAA